MPRKHKDGRILDDRGEAIGRWDDNVHGVRQWAISHNRDPDEAEAKWRAGCDGPGQRIVKKVEGYYEDNRHRADRGHGKNWLRVLVAFGQYQERGIKPYSAAEARESAKTWRGWEEVALALEGLESVNYRFAHGYDPAASAYQQEGTKDGYIPPDSDKWLGGPRGPAEASREAAAAPEPDADYKAEQDAFAAEVERFQAARDAGEPDAQHGFDEWKRLQSPAGALFPFNGVYVEDTRTGCHIANDHVARRRDELTAENVRYRLDCDRPDGIRQISWLALNYEGCLCWLPEYDKEKADKTRMVPAEEIPDLIAAGWRVLSEEEYADNQRTKGAKDDRFSAFRLYVQYDPQDNPLGVCPLQGDLGFGGKWRPNAELFARMQGRAVEEIAPVDAPVDIANAIQAGDWAEVARLAQERAGS